MRWMWRGLLVVVLAGLALAALGVWNARADPVVRRAALALPGWPDGAAPVTVALLSDVHIGSVTMDAARLTRIVRQVNALHPDLVVLAGDFIDGHGYALAREEAPALVAPLRGLRAPLGVVAVPGNHDQAPGLVFVLAALRAAGVTVLRNDAVARGPLAIGGTDDAWTRHADVPATVAATRALPGARLIVSHSPDVAPMLPPDMTLLMAGHTHCGQIVLPVYGPIVEVSGYGARYRCGVVREGRRVTIVTAGLGTSMVPLRYGAPPDLWLVALSGRPGVSRRRP